jgi:hypothetical protein
LAQNNNQQVMQEFLIPQPTEPQPIEAEEVAENALEVVSIHLLNEENDFVPLEIHEDDLMNDDEIQEMENDQNMDWQQDQAVQVDNIQLGMIRIIDRFHPDTIASKSNDLVSMNDHLFKQSDPNKMMTNGSSFPPSKSAGTTLIEVPKKWANFF